MFVSTVNDANGCHGGEASAEEGAATETEEEATDVVHTLIGKMTDMIMLRQDLNPLAAATTGM